MDESEGRGVYLSMTHRPPRLDAWRNAPYDAVIVGGGPAGLSAALVLGRANKRVLVVDSDRPANAVSQGVGGLLGHDGVKPADLRRSGRRQLEEHANVDVRHGAVEDVEPTEDGFVVTPAGAAPVRAHAIVLAHGLRYDPPPLPGIEALWGRSVFHCAFCDGWEVRDRPLAFHGSGPAAVRSALMLAGWSNDVVLCTDGAPDPGGALLSDAGVQVRTERIARLAGSDGRLTRIEFTHGPAERREALFVNTRRDQPNGLAAALGCELTGAGTILTDADGRTNVAGLYAAGDAATAHSRSVANAIGTGSRVAYAVALDRVAPVVAAAA
jgi:thioredoxin reductase